MSLATQYITTQKLGSGWAAVHMVYVDEKTDKIAKSITALGYWDVQQTGIGRYKTQAEAQTEAIAWAEAEEIEYKEYNLK